MLFQQEREERKRGLCEQRYLKNPILKTVTAGCFLRGNLQLKSNYEHSTKWLSAFRMHSLVTLLCHVTKKDILIHFFGGGAIKGRVHRRQGNPIMCPKIFLLYICQ